VYENEYNNEISCKGIIYLNKGQLKNIVHDIDYDVFIKDIRSINIPIMSQTRHLLGSHGLDYVRIYNCHNI